VTRVLVDLLFMDGHKGGMELYVQNLYEQFAGAVPVPDMEFIGLASTELIAQGASWFPGELVDSRVSGAHRQSWAKGEVLAVNAAARRTSASLIHSPANFGPWWGAIPVVLTVHDLLPFRLPGMTGQSGLVIRAMVRQAAAHATRIITDSEASRADIIDVLGPGAPVDTIPLAGGPTSRTHEAPREPGLLLALGNRLPHKNFETLIRAVAAIPQNSRPHLIITGGGERDPLRPLVAQLALESWVELGGWLSSAQVEALYTRATAVVVPTLFEGFGLPVLEAMARGCPVLCSDLPVLHEVAGDAAIYFDPRDTASLAATISAALADSDRLVELARLGRDRNDAFSWGRTAELTARTFRDALGS
jgi:glycosyltransferase involved in cell wall biosynthesis